MHPLMKISLRDVQVDGLPLFSNHQQDPVAVAMVGFQSRDAPAFEAHWAKLLADETVLKQTIVVDDQVVGHVLSFIRDGKREVGYWIDRTFWVPGRCHGGAHPAICARSGRENAA